MLDLVVDIRKRYRWGLLAIAILISVSVSLMQYLLYIQKGDAQVINLAGKQRMLSQKIALYEMRLSSNSQSKHISIECYCNTL